MLDALIETCKQLLKNTAIVDTVWTDSEIDETLYDVCAMAIEEATGLKIGDIIKGAE